MERAKKCIVAALLDNHEFVQSSKQLSNIDFDENGTKKSSSILSHEDFRIVSSSHDNNNNNDEDADEKCIARPLHMESATQLGLMNDPTIPSLVKYLLPDSAPAPTRRFLRRWLLTPPPPLDIADSMAALVCTSHIETTLSRFHESD